MAPGTAPMSAHKLRTPWKATDLFADLPKVTIQLSSSAREESKDMLWRSICSEHDARHFYRYLIGNGPQLPWKMQDFLAGWLADEVNHARGFKILYRALYGVSFDEIEERLRHRVIDFAPIGEFFSDLLSVCFLFAYDELVTTRIYQLSIPFYEQFGTASAKEWIRRLVYDEARHFSALMRVIHEHCDAEVPQAQRLLARIIEVDLAQDDYRGTFVLDHACPEFPLTKTGLTDLGYRGILAPLFKTSAGIAGCGVL